MERDAKLYQDLLKVLVTREEIQAAVKALGEKITADYAGKEPVLIGILKGAVVFYSDLIREIDLPLTTEFMAISSYGSATDSPLDNIKIFLKQLFQPIISNRIISPRIRLTFRMTQWPKWNKHTICTIMGNMAIFVGSRSIRTIHSHCLYIIR